MKKAERRRIDAFELWCWGRGLEEAPLKLGDLAGELTLQPKVVEMGVGCQD